MRILNSLLQQNLDSRLARLPPGSDESNRFSPIAELSELFVRVIEDFGKLGIRHRSWVLVGVPASTASEAVELIEEVVTDPCNPIS